MLLRLFGDLSAGPAHHYRMITETVVFTMLAERGLGPQLQAVFPGGEWPTLFKYRDLLGEMLGQADWRSLSWVTA